MVRKKRTAVGVLETKPVVGVGKESVVVVVVCGGNPAITLGLRCSANRVVWG